MYKTLFSAFRKLTQEMTERLGGNEIEESNVHQLVSMTSLLL